MTWDKVDLPLPFGPMSAATSPSRTVRSRSSRILRPATETLRFLTSSTIFPRLNFSGFEQLSAACPLEFSLLQSRKFLAPLFVIFRRNPMPTGSAYRIAGRGTSADAPFERNRDQFLRFHREFHRQLLQHIAHEAVDDQSRRLLARKPTLHAIKQLILGNLRRRRLMFELRAGGLRFDIRHRMGAARIADEQRIAIGEIAGAGRFPVRRNLTAIGILRSARGNSLR